MRGLQDRVALVTGAGGAIGRAVSLRLAEEGCLVGAFDIDGGAAEDTAASIRAVGGRAHAVTVDIADYDAVRAGVASLDAVLGPVDILVNNAGWDRFRNFLDTDPELWDRLIAVNLRGPINMHHAVLGAMAARGGGRVVNVASDAGRVGSSGEAVYSACKGGLIALTKTLAREMAPQRVLLNAVCPGPTDTPLFRSFLDEGESGQKVYESLRRAVPLKRLGEPDDMPGIVAFLASDDAAYITGQVISVSGGLTMHG
ncbi:MAG: glucose 1-dehydrogenase [Alphaproteobacteria bacterium]|nr:glucose 1-dehydrogenase [Alphaproteobacteria bacterium]